MQEQEIERDLEGKWRIYFWTRGTCFIIFDLKSVVHENVILDDNFFLSDSFAFPLFTPWPCNVTTSLVASCLWTYFLCVCCLASFPFFFFCCPAKQRSLLHSLPVFTVNLPSPKQLFTKKKKLLAAPDTWILTVYLQIHGAHKAPSWKMAAIYLQLLRRSSPWYPQAQENKAGRSCSSLAHPALRR